jgi:hypothetical protein
LTAMAQTCARLGLKIWIRNIIIIILYYSAGFGTFWSFSSQITKPELLQGARTSHSGGSRATKALGHGAWKDDMGNHKKHRLIDG